MAITFLWDMVAVELTKDEYKELTKTDSVEYIEKDEIVKGSSEKSFCINKMHKKKTRKIKKNTSDNEWNLRMIHADDTNLTKKEIKEMKENKVKIAILDSGVDYGNDIELASSVSLVPGEEEMSPLFMDGSGHGNSVAGLIAAKDDEEGITGVNPNVEIHSIRVLDDNNEAPLSRVIEGIYMAIDKNVNIINMSFGLDNYSEALKQAMEDASNAGILVIAAAGNTGENGVQYPAAYEEVVAVGSVDQTGEVAESSSKGEEIEVVAPGELVRSTGILPGVELVESGTSLAAPQVAGVASLIWAKDMTESADFVRYAIQRSANAYGDYEEYGNGLVDVEYALENYEEIKEEYYSEDREETVSQNQKEVLSFEETGCVEGSWYGNDHAAMVDYVGDYKNVKKGSRFPDTTKSIYVTSYYSDGKPNDCIFARISKNPWWHGTYQQSTNYVASYIYETRLANKYATGTEAAIPKGLTTTQAEEIKKDLKILDKENEGWINEYGYNPSDGTKRAFAWGMAIHNLADAFAHSAYVYSVKDKKYYHLAHTDGLGYDYADITSRYKPRYENAASAVRSSIEIYNDKYKSGTYQEFNSVFSNGNVYLLRNLEKNINEISEGAGNTYSIYSYIKGVTETQIQNLLAMGATSLIPGSAKPYK